MNYMQYFMGLPQNTCDISKKKKRINYMEKNHIFNELWGFHKIITNNRKYWDNGEQISRYQKKTLKFISDAMGLLNMHKSFKETSFEAKMIFVNYISINSIGVSKLYNSLKKPKKDCVRIWNVFIKTILDKWINLLKKINSILNQSVDKLEAYVNSFYFFNDYVNENIKYKNIIFQLL